MEERRKNPDYNNDIKDIYEKLNSIEIQITKISAQLDNGINRIDSSLGEHHNILHGNGKEGVIVRIDRLEQSEKSRTHHALAAWSAVIGLIAKSVWDLFNK